MTSLSLGAAAGCGVALIGAGATWYRFVENARVDIPSLAPFPNAFVVGPVHAYSAADLGSPLPFVAGLCLVVAVLALLTGPRARPVLLSLLAMGSVAMVAMAFFVRAPTDVAGVLERGPGRLLTVVGAGVAAAGASRALPLAPRVPRFRLPEVGPEERDAPT